MDDETRASDSESSGGEVQEIDPSEFATTSGRTDKENVDRSGLGDPSLEAVGGALTIRSPSLIIHGIR